MENLTPKAMISRKKNRFENTMLLIYVLEFTQRVIIDILIDYPDHGRRKYMVLMDMTSHT